MEARSCLEWRSCRESLQSLLTEVKRQESYCTAEHQDIVQSRVSIGTHLGQMGRKYQEELRALAAKLEECISMRYFDTCSESLGLASLADWSLPEESQLEWQIPLFCANSTYLDPDVCRSRWEALHENFRHNHQFWTSDVLQEWASAPNSSVLRVQGDAETSETVDQITLDLLKYLEDNRHPFVYALDYLRSKNETSPGNRLLHAIFIQLIKRYSGSKSIAKLARTIERIHKATLSSDWIDIIRYALQASPLKYLCIVINLSQLQADSSFLPWINEFSSLFDLFKPSFILKVVLLGCWPLPTDEKEPLTIDITASTGPLWHRAYREYTAVHKEDRFLGFPVHEWQNLSWPEAAVDPGTIDPRHETNSDVASQGNFTEHMHVSIQGETPSSNIIGDVAAAKGHRGNGDWFCEMRSFEKLVDASRKEPDVNNQRVRVAVLDTGVDLSHREIAKAKNEGRLQFHDFVEQSDTIMDESGHGTHCTSLVLKYAPNAEVFVGRVFRKNEADNDSCSSLTKAIQHATSILKVDIISISLGFTFADDSDEAYHDLQVELRRASGNTLIFASAANNTTNEPKPIRFPARMWEVLCIFSSDSFGKPSTFNPPAKYDRPNLMFPGEKIKGAWPAALADNETILYKDGQTTYKLLSGTSCATPIAAAVAAGIIEFAWQPREWPVRRVRQLKHFTGMTQVFLKYMLDEYKTGDNSYNYVKPWKLISTSRRKEEIPVLISNALECCDG